MLEKCHLFSLSIKQCLIVEDFNITVLLSTFRLESHRHNPYIGSFHTVDRRTKPSSSSMLLDTSLKNPFIGTIRHSPAGSSAGLKGILWEVQFS